MLARSLTNTRNQQKLISICTQQETADQNELAQLVNHATCRIDVHEMDVGRQKPSKNCDFEVPAATLSHEMDVGRQKLR